MKFIDIQSLGRNLFPVRHDLEKLQTAIAEMNSIQAKAFVEEFESIVENRMSLWNVGDSFSKVGMRFLLGVCPIWNMYDAYLLDNINDSLKKKLINETLDILNLDSINSLGELQKIFGDNPKKVFSDTAVLGIWKEGIFQKSLWGWDAKNFLIEKFSFVWQPSQNVKGQIMFIK